MFKVQASSGLSWADHMDMSESLPYPRTPRASDAVTPFQILSAQGRYMRPGLAFIKPAVPGGGRAV